MIRFGEAAGDRFDWQAVAQGGSGWTTGDRTFALAHNLHGRVSGFPALQGSAPLEAVLRYLLDRGVACPQSNLYTSTPTPSRLCVRPTCPATSGNIYSCSVCAGFPLRNQLYDGYDSESCVSRCGRNKVLDATTWPDGQCKCTHGVGGDFGCLSEYDVALIQEVRGAANLATIRVLLSLGANPNAADGVLFEVAKGLKAGALSVLITAGANSSVRVGGVRHTIYNIPGISRSIPEALLLLGLDNRAMVGPEMAETFVHFGNAAGDSFDWQATGLGGIPIGELVFGLLDGLRRRAEGTPSRMGELPHLRTMARHLVSRGVTCSTTNRYLRDNNAIPADALCNCPAGQSVLDGVCSACRAGQTQDNNGQCVIDGATPSGMLAAEIQKTSPSLATVRAALDAGANPDVMVDGRPALIAAGRGGHAKIVSVLVTAGANVNARDPRDNSYSNSRDFALHAVGRLSNPGFPALRATRASLLYHFGDALDVRNAIFGDAKFNWNFTLGGHAMLDGIADAVVFDTGFQGQDDLNILKEMADYAILRGAMCAHSSSTGGSQAARDICDGSAEVQMHVARASLIAEVEKAAGAANVSVVAALLSGANAVDPNIEDSFGLSPLILAARNGHPEVVSVLITAGADVNATDSTFLNADVAQHAAGILTDPAAGPRALRASVLYYFGGGLDVRNAMFGDAHYDWNRADDNGDRLLDLLALAEDETPRPEGEDAGIIYQMADYALARGADCGDATADKTRYVCAGSPRFMSMRALLVAEVEKAPGAAAVTVVLDLLDETGVHPNVEDSSGRPLLILAARNGHAEIVSVLITAGGGCKRGGSGLSRL